MGGGGMRLEYNPDYELWWLGNDPIDPADAAERIEEMQDKIERLEEELLHASYTVPSLVEQRDKLLERVDELEEHFRNEHNARTTLDEFKCRVKGE
jgi:predicted RNase H-like nuclease (RuvC/YqgF family)